MGILLGFFIAVIPLVILIGIVLLIVKNMKSSSDPSQNLLMKEVLVDIGIFISLLTSIVSLISIVFAAIDKKFVDVLSQNYNYGSIYANDDIRISVSVILVSYPIYLGLSYYRAKYLRENPDRRSVKALRYVNYLVLGVAGLFILGSLITTIYSYLGGELGTSFALKLLTVAVISFGLFAYNYFSIKRDYSKRSKLSDVFALVSALLILGAVVYSVNIMGSPSYVRKARFDDKRLVDLSNIQNEVLNNWQRNKKLPATLTEVNGDGFNSGFVLPSDPKTKEQYTYNIIENSTIKKGTKDECFNYYKNTSVVFSGNTCDMPSSATFEICANFETVRIYDENGMDLSGKGWQNSNSLGVYGLDAASLKYYSADSSYYYGGYNQNNPNWNHDAKYTCFKRVIDPTKYVDYYIK